MGKDKDKDSVAGPQSSTAKPVNIPLDFEDALKALLGVEPGQGKDAGGSGES